MRILINIIPVLMLCVFSCSPVAPITPQDALDFLRKAYNKGDADAVMRILSAGSLEKIRSMNTMFASMQPSQLKAIAEKYNLPEDRLRSLSVRDGVMLVMFLDPERSALALALKSNPVSFERNENRMVFRMVNGMDLLFVREGPYWKLDMTDL